MEKTFPHQTGKSVPETADADQAHPGLRGDESTEYSVLTPKVNIQPQSAFNALVRDLRATAAVDPGGYSVAVGFVLGAIFRDLVLITASKPKSASVPPASYRVLLTLISKAAIHLLMLAPTASHSLRVAHIWLIASRFIRTQLPEQHLAFSHAISELTSEWASNHSILDDNGEPTRRVESINILLAAGAACDDSAIDIDIVGQLLGPTTGYGYFEVVSALAFARGRGEYANLTQLLKLRAVELLSRADRPVQRCSETSHLLLDLLACPYLDIDFKLELLSVVALFDGTAKARSDWTTALQGELSGDWFTEWLAPDLLLPLERRHLTSAY